MASKLKSTLRIENLAVGATEVVAHGLNLNGTGCVPDNVERADLFLTIVSADATSVTVRNDGVAAISTWVLCEHWHTFERVFGNAALHALTPQPFVPASTFAAGGGSVFVAYRETAVSTTLLLADQLLVVLGTAGPVTVTLPAASTFLAGRRYTVKDGDGGSAVRPILLDPSGADTIDGEAAATLQLAYGSLDIASNGVDGWYIL